MAAPRLRFNRAVFLEFDEPTAQLVYSLGVGSTRKEEFTRIANELRWTRLSQVLESAGKFRDNDLDLALGGFSLETRGQRPMDFLRHTDAEGFPGRKPSPWPQLIEELGRRIDARQVMVAPVRLAAAVGSEPRPAGLFLVDFRWTDRPLAEADRMALAVFAQQAGQILRQHDLQRRMLESHDRATRGFLTDGLAHQFQESLGIFHDRIKELQLDLEHQNLGDASGTLVNGLLPNVEYLIKTVRAVKGLISRDKTTS